MSNKIAIGPSFSLPLSAVTQTFAFLGKRGSGKTHGASVMVEGMVQADLPVVVLDPVGSWWGIRTSADGTGPGLAVYVLGGSHGDLPLEPTAGAVVADFIIESRRPTVLDFSTFSKNEQRRFVTDFSERVYQTNRDPLHVVLDECDAFAPQRPMKGEERMLGAVNDLVRRGRARGIGVTLITQRPAVVHKDVLTQVETIFAFRMPSPQDRDAVKRWVEVNDDGAAAVKAALGELPSLPIGTAWVWSPGWLGLWKRIAIHKRTTFDSSATPEVGSRAVARYETPMAAVDLGALKTRMAETVERVKQDDPKELRKKITELQGELEAAERARMAGPRAAPQVSLVEVPVVADSLFHGFRQGIDRLDEKLAELRDLLLTVEVQQRQILTGMTVPEPEALPVPLPRVPRTVATPSEPGGNEEALRFGERRIVETIASFRVNLDRGQVATLCGFAVTGGTFRQYMGRVIRLGYVEEVNKALWATEKGRQYSRTPTVVTTEQVIDRWKESLRAGERNILDKLLSAYPNWMTLPAIALSVEMEHEGGTFRQYIGRLVRNGLVEKQGGYRRASETLFIVARETA